MQRCALLLLVAVMAGGASAFLATPVNLTDHDVANILCPGSSTGVSRDHEWITQEAIRRNIREFFMAYPPPQNPSFYLPPDASLSELFHLYYGSIASPTRFIKAVNSISMSNIKTDSSHQLRYDPSLHADGEQLEDTHKKLTGRYPQILSSIVIDESYPAARSLIGTSLHAIQDFYSHSTWIEQGNKAILKELGIPGYYMGGVAGPSDSVCTPCSSSQGSCYGNVLASAGLSSGYYTYTSDLGSGFLVPKPPFGGKCSHGGSLDDSSIQPAIGGINKDTVSPCFSPHHHLHYKAAELAVEATQYYLDQILYAVGYDMYRRLFDLYQGSALSICIDTTGSMTDDIDAVKYQVSEIVANSSPELYILAPFNDPECGPVFKTTDGAAFIAEVNKLKASGGGDFPELFWCGLQLALSETPDYGDVFCFTDADGKDGGIMDSVTSLAQQQNNKVTVILSDMIKTSATQEKSQAETEPEGKRAGMARDDVITSLDEYQRLTDATGGLLISSSKFDVSEIVGIMGGVVTSTVTILQQDGAGTLTTSFPADDTFEDMEVRLSGELSSATLTGPLGTTYNLTDQKGLEAAGVEIITFTDFFMALRWTKPHVGEWLLHAVPTVNVTLTVLATSSLDFMSNFALLDPTPPHPHYRPTEGQPLMNTIYYIEVTLVGHRESHVAVVTSVQFINRAGTVLRDIAYPMAVSDQVYLWTDPLPEEPFFVRVLGYLASGKVWMRQVPVQVQPVNTLVELYSTTDKLEAPPGGTASASFMVVNYGLESYFSITATDNLNFLTSVIPSRVFLGTNQTTLVQTNFQVSVTAIQGQVSTVLVTARSETQTLSVNTALAHFFVLPSVVDLVAPTCVLDNNPNCNGFNNNGLCNLHPWQVVATLQDHGGSGLYVVSYAPEGSYVSVTGFTPGTQQEVYVIYEANCCTTKVHIRGTDGQGNVGQCELDMGEVGGIIYYFEVEISGDTWLAVRWNTTASNLDVSYYNIVVNNKKTYQVPCHELSCQDYLNYLDPCTIYHLNVTPVFEYMGGELEGVGAYTEGVTLDDAAQAPINGREVDATETTITIAWEPAKPACSFQYEVCVYEVTADPSTATCVLTTDTFLTVRGLLPCHAYLADVMAKASSHNSDPLTFYSVTLCTSIP